MMLQGSSQQTLPDSTDIIGRVSVLLTIGCASEAPSLTPTECSVSLLSLGGVSPEAIEWASL
jgi:hypothetical protein